VGGGARSVEAGNGGAIKNEVAAIRGLKPGVEFEFRLRDGGLGDCVPLLAAMSDAVKRR
jgi:hypothetical protein